MQRVTIRDDAIHVGRFVSISFQRTLRIPDDDRAWPLPRGLGRFPLRRVRDYARRVPAQWRERGGVFLPMYQCEALWLAFGAPYWHPSAVKVAVGGVNAVSGRIRDDARLRRRPQDYVVVPDQPWLDGIKAGQGTIRQFVAVPLGSGMTVEGQLAGDEVDGGLQLTVVAARRGLFPEREPRRSGSSTMAECCDAIPSPPPGMGLGAGGRMVQRIYPDDQPRGTWDAASARVVHVHLATTRMWASITGEAPPPTPVSAEAYLRHGLPWFGLYDEHRGDLAPPAALRKVRSVAAMMAGAGS